MIALPAPSDYGKDMDLSRPMAPDPYEILPAFPAFTLTSADLEDGAPMPPLYAGVGDNISPQLSWSGFPAHTRGFTLNCFDPDAPTPAGYWHWTVIDLDAETTSLQRGAGTSDLALPGDAHHVRNDSNTLSYTGAAPPPGDRPHRYIFAVHALDVPSLGLNPQEATATAVAFQTLFHTIARARLTVTFRR